ncbi:hypothetical protein DL771_010180 [Monosporascus sp. 5C6A]|nr:hypothetical protein DL771_010180 [Monosporascus sp. 5C6A]
MRLLMLRGNGDLSLTKDLIKDIPPYAILSHTWGDDDQEVTFKDVKKGTGRDKAGYRKIQFCGQQAASDGLQYFWVDTCCIDKSNNTELSEAINSMFKWYKKAARCYVYLPDVSKYHCAQHGDLLRPTWKLAFRRSRWFTRGWTLQELIAPSSVEFFSAEGQRLGNRATLEQLIHEITRIAISALRGRDLSKFSTEERMSWSHGRETGREEDRAYSLLGIFDVYLPPIYGEGVANAFRRLHEEISKHSPITYKKAEVEKPVTWKDLRDLLYFDDIDARLLTLKAAHNKTCQWFLEKEQYKAWMTAEKFREHHGFIWIKGKPGAGKSTLMKFLDSDAKKAAKSNPGAVVVSFFFNARGEQLEKSTTGLYRSLLWQLFEKAEDLQEVLDDIDSNARRIIQRDGWQLEILKETLAKAVEGLGCRTLQFFIDALDECHDDDVTDMISFFEKVGVRAVETNIRLHICFSSRHYPAIRIRWGLHIVLENEKEHDADIKQYIKAEVNLDDSRQAGSLRYQILEKSAGIFLWVALVIPMLNKACAQGRVDEFQKCLDGIPLGLDNLFEMILTRDGEDIQKLQLCIQWILFAKRPLKPEEYFFALRSPNSLETTRCWVLGDVSAEVMHRFVHSSSKGLAEVTKTGSADQKPTVQFIHESVQDFFLAKDGNRSLWPDFDGPFVTYSHKVLKDRCLAEINRSGGDSTLSNLSEETMHRSLSEEFPFLEYAVRHVLHHADAAESDITDQDDFLKEFPLKHWIYLDNLFEEDWERRHTPSASLLYILAERNLPRLIKYELQRLQNMDILGERYYYPMFAACVNGNQDAIAALLMQDTKPQSDPNLASQLSYLREFKPQQSQKPLSYAAEKGHEGILQLRLKTGKVNADSEGCYDRTPLSYAAENGYEGVAKLLLETGKVNADSKAVGYSNTGRTPLSYAAQRGHEGIVKLLLETGKVNTDSKSYYDRTPLSYAAENGYEGIVKLLLETDKINTDSKNYYGRTPLSYAAENGYEGIVKLLLETGKVDANSKNGLNRTPLSYAAKEGHEDIVKLLLETGKIDVDSKDVYGWTPLSHASQNGHEGILKLLLETGNADADSKDMKGQTPLSYAVVNGYRGIVELLLKTGKANADWKGPYNRTPLSYAAENGYKCIVKLLLETGKVDANSKDMKGQTPRSYASKNRHKDIVELLQITRC